MIARAFTVLSPFFVPQAEYIAQKQEAEEEGGSIGADTMTRVAFNPLESATGNRAVLASSVLSASTLGGGGGVRLGAAVQRAPIAAKPMAPAAFGGFVIHVDAAFKPAGADPVSDSPAPAFSSAFVPALTPAPAVPTPSLAPAPALAPAAAAPAAALEIVPRTSTWIHMPVERETQKENTMQPSTWTGVQVRTYTYHHNFSPATSPLRAYQLYLCIIDIVIYFRCHSRRSPRSPLRPQPVPHLPQAASPSLWMTDLRTGASVQNYNH